MSKTELAQAVAKKFELSKVKGNEIVSCVLELITKSLIKNDPVQLIGFGTFSIRKRKARVGRNPRTGESVKILARKAIGFSAGKALKDAVNKR